jgi:hypothetical protein
MTKRVSQCARQRLDEGMLGFVPLQVLATAARALGYGMILKLCALWRQENVEVASLYGSNSILEMVVHSYSQVLGDVIFWKIA